MADTGIFSKARHFFLARFQAQACNEDIDVADSVVDNVIEAAILHFFDMEKDYQQWSLTYRHPRPSVISLVMDSPGVHNAVIDLLKHEFDFNGFSGRLFKKIASEYTLSNRNFEPTSTYLRRKVNDAVHTSFDRFMNEHVGNLARQHAQEVFDSGVRLAMEKMTQRDNEHGTATG